jgi:hypothetical protein
VFLHFREVRAFPANFYFTDQAASTAKEQLEANTRVASTSSCACTSSRDRETGARSSFRRVRRFTSTARQEPGGAQIPLYTNELAVWHCLYWSR